MALLHAAGKCHSRSGGGPGTRATLPRREAAAHASTMAAPMLEAASAAPQLVFGYGSVVNDDSRATTTGGGEPTAAARLLPGSGWVRAWNFRSDTGFTALGVRRAARTGPGLDAPPTLAWSFFGNGSAADGGAAGATSPVLSSPALGADGSVYYGSLDGSVYALFSDGAPRCCRAPAAAAQRAHAALAPQARSSGATTPARPSRRRPASATRWVRHRCSCRHVLAPSGLTQRLALSHRRQRHHRVRRRVRRTRARGAHQHARATRCSSLPLTHAHGFTTRSD